MATATLHEIEVDELFAVMPELASRGSSPIPSTTSATGDELLARIDETLDLIASADRDTERLRPLDRVDVSIVLAVRNVRQTLPEVLDRINEVMPPATETIIVDDASTDGTTEFARSRVVDSRVRLIRRQRSHGRGSALRCGIRHSRGHVVAITDASLAYDPADLLGGIWPILEDRADAVYGSRNLRRNTPRATGWSGMMSRISNSISTSWSNRSTRLRLSDLQNPQKVFRGEMIRQWSLRQSGEGFDAEVTGKMAAAAKVVMEIPTHYDPEMDVRRDGQFWQSIRATFVA